MAENTSDYQDKARGMLAGLAIGDALGAPYEFGYKSEDIVKLGDKISHFHAQTKNFKLPKGAWTDDTSMALCIADSLLEKGGYDSYDMMDKFTKWFLYGYRSSVDHSVGIGQQTSLCLLMYGRHKTIPKGTRKTNRAGNGPIMRLAPIVIASTKKDGKQTQFADHLIHLAQLSCRETHDSYMAIATTTVFAGALDYALHYGFVDEHIFRYVPDLYPEDRNEYIGRLLESIQRSSDECGVQLVSASESIDDTPAGMLLHGIMSSIAEFYSQNLATEVKKGLGEKVKSGGTVSKAPIGYQNVRLIDDKGREERTVILDPERAPLIKLAFEEYATGNWTVADLAEHLAACGLNTRSTPRIPSQPITLKTLHKVMVNPYYKGVVTYKGIEYKGAHEALIDTETWDKVQSILASRINGERNLKHPHFLKGSVYCAYCGERLIVSNEKKKDGTVYPYFVCNGRHSKRRRDCKTKAVLIDVVEKEIEKIYDSYQLPTKVRILIETYLQKVIADEKRKYESELDGLKGQKAALENKRKKLLEAHYSDAIPLDLMKTEQQKITKELAAIDHEIDLHNITFEQISANLDMVLDIVENCGEAYRNASDTIKKLMNQAIFEKFYISNGPEDEFGVKLTFKAPYDQILDPIKEDLSQINTALKRKPEAVDGLADKAKGHIHDFFGCGPNLGQNKNPYSNEPDFFNPNSSSKDLMCNPNTIDAAP